VIEKTSFNKFNKAKCKMYEQEQFLVHKHIIY